MSAAQSLLIMYLAVLGTTQSSTPREYTPEELPQLVADFQLQHELFDRAGAPIANSTVDDFVRVNVHGAGQIVGAHDLVIYIDGRFVLSRSDIRFPYEFTWNFKGLLNGPHSMMLVFTKANDERGLVHLNLTVQH